MNNQFLERRPIGKTGLQSSRLGIGANFNPPTEVIESAFDRGINYFYWGSARQPGFGRAMHNLAHQHRDEMILTVQTYTNAPETIYDDVEGALKSAGLEYFDFLLLGSRSETPGPAYLEAFERLRGQGKVRFLSLSSHNRPLIPKLIADYAAGQSPYELLMLRYNAVHRGAERDVFPSVPAANGPAILTYTATRWGHLLDPDKMPPGEAPASARDCYRYSLSHQAADMVLCGPANAAQMDEAITALERGPLLVEERERLERIGAYIYGKYAPAFAELGDEADVAAGVAVGMTP